MSYTDTAIETLSKRIGFGTAMQDHGISFSADIVSGPSGRTFGNFSKLCTIDNLYFAVDSKDMDKDPFEANLEEMRLSCARSIVAQILDQSEKYDPGTDYSQLISDRSPLFEEAIGYAVAIASIDLMITSKRSNLAELNAELSYEKLQLAINGFKTEQGVIVAVGLSAKLLSAVKSARKSIFKRRSKIKGSSPW
jgi:hypothetical protein